MHVSAVDVLLKHLTTGLLQQLACISLTENDGRKREEWVWDTIRTGIEPISKFWVSILKENECFIKQGDIVKGEVKTFIMLRKILLKVI